jgi:hypothetical protein
MIKKLTCVCLFLLWPVQTIFSEESFPLKLGDDLKMAEMVLGDLLPGYKVVFPGLNEEDIKNLTSKGASRCLGSKRYGVFLGITSHDKVHSIRINREHAELYVNKPLYGVLPTSNLESIRAVYGPPIKEEENGSEYRTYFFRYQGILLEATFLLKDSSSYKKVRAGELITFAVENAP